MFDAEKRLFLIFGKCGSLVKGPCANIPKIVSETQWNCQSHVYTS